MRGTLLSARAAAPLCVLVAVSLSCSSGGSEPNPPPPPPPPPPTPANLVKQAGDNQTGEPGQVVPVPPAVRVTSSSGAAISGVTVTFGVASGGGSVAGATPSTGADGVATVGSWTLGAAEGENTLSASIVTQGVTGNPALFTATGEFPSFSPTANTMLTGSRTFKSVNIPAGVTVTITADATINVIGDYTQAGVVLAPCHRLTIDAGGVVNVTGNIENDCADPDADGENLIIIGRGGYTIEGNELVSSGDIYVMDGPDLNFAPPLASYLVGRPPHDANATSWRCRLINTTLKARPTTRKKAANGSPKGSNGRPGASRTSGCGQLLSGQVGGHLLVNGVTFEGGGGGEGGDGASNSSVEAVGGDGGPPGFYALVSDGDIDLMGTVTFTLGDGGAGGNATATAPGGNPGGNALARGGMGAGLRPNNSSPVRIESRTGTITVHNQLTVTFGTAGKGGDATATGGNGDPGNPGAKGGDATANGGMGGSAPAFQLNQGGSIVFLLGSNVTINGGTAGDGGKALRIPGNGGAGNVPGAAGGDAGSAFGDAGKGGNGQPSAFGVSPIGDLANVMLESPGGNGGASQYQGGTGGAGAIKCPSPGGAGGKGANANGSGGDLGQGTPAGAISSVTFTGFGNGGAGAQGNGPGGAAGANNASFGSNATGTPPAGSDSFNPGPPGPPCPGEGPSIAFAFLTPPTQTVFQGGSGSISVGFTRSNYDGIISVVVMDQGGTARGGGTIPGGSTSGSVFFSVPSTEPIGMRTWTATASGSGVPNVSMGFGLNVTPPPQPSTVDVDLNTMPNSGGAVPFGTHTLDLKFGTTTRGTMDYQTVSAPGHHFWSDVAPFGVHIGMDDGHGFRALLSTAVVDGSPYVATGYGYCLFLGTGVSMATPVVINQRNAGGTIVSTELVTSLPAGDLCRWDTILSGVAIHEILAPVGGFVALKLPKVWK